MAVNTSKGIVRFAAFELDLRTGELRKDNGSTVRLSEQPFQILTILLEHAGEVVSREEIRKKLWPNDTIVEFEHSISAAMNRLRQALGDSADNPRYIETLARRGYRLLVPVEWVQPASPPADVGPGLAPARPIPHAGSALQIDAAAETGEVAVKPVGAANLLGKKVSHYRVLEVLGGGGMGVVYKAEDLKLGRMVALKFLPEELANDRAALERFEREARAASALNHPNICTVHEFGEHEGQPFIAMELLEGQTLRDRIAGRSVGVPPAVAGASRPSPAEQERGQDALATAGETPALPGAPLQEATATTDPYLTKTGVAIGTAAYMSPEQVRGEKLDARTDLFSFGVVLYEMATGRQAFAGGSSAETLTAILRDRPVPPSQLNPQLPSKLEEIINKSLEKDREVRCQTASEMLAELRSLKQAIDSGHSVAPGLGKAAAVKRRHPGAIREPLVPKRSRLLVASVFTLIGVALGGVWLFLSRQGQRQGPLRIVPFSGLSGLEGSASFSPDGKQLAYAWNGGAGSVFHIYVKLVGAGTPLQLTHGSLSDGDPVWSPDGRYIAFIRYSSPGLDGKSEVISIPALGGQEHRLAAVNLPPFSGRDLTWSPDGKSVAVGERTSAAEGIGVFLISSENGEKHRLTSPPQASWGDKNPAFSPDGRAVAFARWSSSIVSDIYLQSVNSMEARRLTFDNAEVEGLAWTPDGRNIVFSSERSGLPTLCKVPASGGEVEPLGFGENAFSPAVSARGNLLAYLRAEENHNIWSIQVTSGGRMAGSPRKLISGNSMQFDDEFSPDGKRIVFASDRSGNAEIWVADSDGSNAAQLTSFGGPWTGTPRWSPDGRRIAFDSRPGGFSGVFVVSAEGGLARRLTSVADDTFAPTWSRDGRWIYFCWNRNGDLDIWKMPAEGRTAVQVTKTGGFEARESKDGRWVYFSRPPASVAGESAKSGIWRMPVEGGPESLILNRPTERLWTLADQYLYFIDVAAKPHATVNRLDLATGKITRMAEVEKDPNLLTGWTGLSVSPGGEWIIYPQVDEQRSRIMLVENFR